MMPHTIEGLGFKRRRMNRKSRRSYSSVLGLVEKVRLGWLRLHAVGSSSKFHRHHGGISH